MSRKGIGIEEKEGKEIKKKDEKKVLERKGTGTGAKKRIGIREKKEKEIRTKGLRIKRIKEKETNRD